MINLSIVIPVYNSEASIVSLVEALMDNLSAKYALEIILVNDGSKDDSDAKCRDLHQRFPKHLSYFLLAKNVGEHAAVLAGLNQSTGDYVLIMDDDFQNPLHELESLVHKIVEGNYDVVYTYSDERAYSFYRKMGSKLNNRMATWMLKKPKTLYLSSFKIMNRFLVDELIKYDLPFPYIDGLILRTTDNLASMKVANDPRKEGKSGYTFAKLFSLWSNMFLNFSLIPLRLVIVVGFIAAFLGFLFGVFTIIEKIQNPNLPAGYSTIITLISFFSGLILIGIGMVGEYVGRIFLSQGKKPQFTIRKSYRKDGN